MANLAVQAGDVLAFYGQGIPYDTTGSDFVSFPAIPALPLQGSVIELDGGLYPDSLETRTYSFGAQVILPSDYVITGGMAKFVDPLPMFGSDIPIAVGDGTGTYEIGLVQYQQQMHRDLANPTLLRGYVELTACTNTETDIHLSNVLMDGTTVDTGYCGVTAPSYLGPAILTPKDAPVRIVFRNLLPTGKDGNLFIPVDSTVMGSGGGPNMPHHENFMDPQNPMCSGEIDPTTGMFMLPKDPRCFAENRATLHLHGGISPW